LLGIETQAQLEKSPFPGPIFEGFIASEIVKAQLNAGQRRELYYFRDQQGGPGWTLQKRRSGEERETGTHPPAPPGARTERQPQSEKGEQGTILKYLELCRKFWGIGGDRLDEWTKAIEEGRIPDFGGNLLY
jgi:hypothetical protein